MLAQRIATALVLALILVGSLFISTEAFLFVLALAFSTVLFEWLRLERIDQRLSFGIALFALVAMGMILIFPFKPKGAWFLALELVVSCIWLAIVALCFNARKTGFKIARIHSILFAFLFVAAAYLSIVWLMFEGGWLLVLSVFAIVWIADVFAYFFGIAFGRHRMAPAISPKKSWEGALGAYVCVFLAAILCWFYVPHEMVLTSRVFSQTGPLAGTLIIFLLVSVSIAGDLFESELKRLSGVKDSGRLLPGHGGFYDRLDSAVAVFPVGVCLLLIL